MSRTASSRRAALLGGASLLLLPGGAQAANPDGELIALLEEARQLMQSPQTDALPALAGAPPPWDAPLSAAAALLARTPEGLRAKAPATADWLAGGDRSWGLPHWCREGEYRLAWSLLRDVLGEPLPETQPSPWSVPATRPPADEELTAACRRYAAAAAEVERRAALLDAWPAMDRQTHDRLWNAMSQAQAVQYEIMDAVAEMPPATMAGVVAKARVALAAFNEDVPEEGRATTERLVGIVLEELVQLGGGAA